MKKLLILVLMTVMFIGMASAAVINTVTSVSSYGNYYPVDITVEDLGNSIRWTFDMMGNKTLQGGGHWGYGLVISTDMIHPLFQLHNNDGTDSSYSWGTHLYSGWGPEGTGYNGWHTSDSNTLASNIDGISATGKRYIIDNPNGNFTITISKDYLLKKGACHEFYWAVHFGVGGFYNPNNGYSKYPSAWAAWSGDASDFESINLPDTVEPDTNTTYFTEQNEEDNIRECVWNENLGQYIAFTNYDNIVGHGFSADSCSSLINIQYRWDNEAIDNAVCDDGDCDDGDNEENWHSPTKFGINDGEISFCGRAKDSSSNLESIDEIDDCCYLCVDTQAPSEVSNLEHYSITSRCWNEDEECSGDQWNGGEFGVSDPLLYDDDWGVGFNWIKPEDAPDCSDVSYYNIKIEKYEVGTVDESSITEETYQFDSKQYLDGEGDNGYEFEGCYGKFRAQVQAVDLAENEGDWSQWTNWIEVDVCAPQAQITNPDASSWHKEDFSVYYTMDDSETDLWKCQLKINEKEWQDVSCESEYIVTVGPETEDDCSTIGQDTCEVKVRAIDSSGNVDVDSRTFSIDYEAPTTIKEYCGCLIEYNGYHWINSKCDISMTAEDGCGIDQSTTYYRVSLLDISDEECIAECQFEGQGNWTEYDGEFNIEEDSCHLIEFYSEDSLGNQELTQKQCVFVDNQPPITTKIYEGIQYFGWRMIQGVNVWMRFITSNTNIVLSSADQNPHPVGVQDTWWTLYTTCEQEGETHPEMYLEGQWYEPLSEEFEQCLTDNGCEIYEGCMEECNITLWRKKIDYMEVYCDSETYNSEEGWCLYEEPINILQECDHKICYMSEDYLGNWEEKHCQVFSVDNIAPEIIVHNPTFSETNIERCAQAIVIEVFDNKAGVNESSIYAELINDSGEGEVVRNVSLEKSVYGTYEALMDKSLPEGKYVLRICASDNLGNKDCEEIQETLVETVFVEYVSPAYCNLDPEQGGNCEFTFHVCMRGGNQVQFWMNKLGGIITPDMMNAVISDGETNAFVGLKHCEEYDEDECEEWFESEAETLMLGTDCEEINGQAEFNLELDITQEVAEQIGIGAHDLEYWIESSLPEDCE